MKRLQILVFISLLLLVGVIGSSSFAAQATDKTPIKIGVYLPLTGQNAFGGELELEGLKLAYAAMPEILGRPVKLVVIDNKSDKVESANAVSRLIEKEKVSAIIGTYGSSLAMAGGEVAEKAKIPVLGTSCTNVLVTKGKKYYFRVCFIDPYQAHGAAAYARKVLNATKVGLLTEVSSDYSVGLSKEFEKSFTKMGGTIVAKLKYSAGDQDFTAQLTDLMSKKPDIVFFPAYFAEGAIVLKQAKELGATFKIMGADAMDNPEIVKIAGTAANGFMHTTFPYDPSMTDMSPIAKKFTENWRKAHPDKEPNVNGALGYDAYMLMLDAINRAGSDNPEAITKALASTKNFEGVTGRTTINSEHNAEKPIGIIIIKNGKKTYLGTIDPSL